MRLFCFRRTGTFIQLHKTLFSHTKSFNHSLLLYFFCFSYRCNSLHIFFELFHCTFSHCYWSVAYQFNTFHIQSEQFFSRTHTHYFSASLYHDYEKETHKMKGLVLNLQSSSFFSKAASVCSFPNRSPFRRVNYSALLSISIDLFRVFLLRPFFVIPRSSCVPSEDISDVFRSVISHLLVCAWVQRAYEESFQWGDVTRMCVE